MFWFESNIYIYLILRSGNDNYQKICDAHAMRALGKWADCSLCFSLVSVFFIFFFKLLNWSEWSNFYHKSDNSNLNSFLAFSPHVSPSILSCIYPILFNLFHVRWNRVNRCFMLKLRVKKVKYRRNKKQNK